MTTPPITPDFSSTISMEGTRLHKFLRNNSQWPLTTRQSQKFSQFLSDISIHLRHSQQDYDYEILNKAVSTVMAFPDAIVLSESAYELSKAFSYCEDIPSPSIDKIELLIKHLHHQSQDFFFTKDDGTMRPLNITPGSAPRIYIPDYGWVKNDQTTLLAILTQAHTEENAPVAQAVKKQRPPYLTLVKS